MSRYARWIVCSVMMMAVGTASASAQEACDRACLRTMLDQYLNAVIKHDPAAAPLVVGFRQTENAINVRPGNGVWKTVTGLGTVQRRYLDPVSGQAAYYGTVEEGGEHRDRDRPCARRRPSTDRSRVVPRAGRRSRSQRSASAGETAGQSSQPGLSVEEPAARSRRPGEPAIGSRHARRASSTATSMRSRRMTTRLR